MNGVKLLLFATEVAEHISVIAVTFLLNTLTNKVFQFAPLAKSINALLMRLPS
jgi:hypothetical protein